MKNLGQVLTILSIIGAVIGIVTVVAKSIRNVVNANRKKAATEMYKRYVELSENHIIQNGTQYVFSSPQKNHEVEIFNYLVKENLISRCGRSGYFQVTDE